MSMGGPGDHWLTDLKMSDRLVFGERCDRLLREILQLGGEPTLLQCHWAERLDAAHPMPGERVEADVALDQYAAELRELRDDLFRRRLAGGWVGPSHGGGDE